MSTSPHPLHPLPVNLQLILPRDECWSRTGYRPVLSKSIPRQVPVPSPASLCLRSHLTCIGIKQMSCDLCSHFAYWLSNVTIFGILTTATAIVSPEVDMTELFQVHSLGHGKVDGLQSLRYLRRGHVAVTNLSASSDINEWT